VLYHPRVRPGRPGTAKSAPTRNPGGRGRANVLGRDFDPGEPNAAWSADITYVPTADGWLYLAVVEDLFSRRIVGWAMDVLALLVLALACGCKHGQLWPPNGSGFY
jgi:transposase InsO family protein